MSIDYLDMVKRLVRAGMSEEKALKEVARAYFQDVKMLKASYEKDSK